MVISDPTPESFQLNQTQVLGSKSSYHPQIYEFEAEVALGGGAAPFATVTVPGVKSEDGAEIHVNQKVALSDSDAFGDFATAVMVNKEVSMNIYGRPGLKQGALPKTTVTYNKTVVMKGGYLDAQCVDYTGLTKNRLEQARGLCCPRISHHASRCQRIRHERNSHDSQSLCHDNHYGTSIPFEFKINILTRTGKPISQPLR
jgi:hypothetical protein